MEKTILTKSELVVQIAQRFDMQKKKAFTSGDKIFETITQTLVSGDKVELRGFGSFTTRKRNPRQSRNPKTGETVHVPAKRVPFFKTGKDLKII